MLREVVENLLPNLRMPFDADESRLRPLDVKPGKHFGLGQLDIDRHEVNLRHV